MTKPERKKPVDKKEVEEKEIEERFAALTEKINECVVRINDLGRRVRLVESGGAQAGFVKIEKLKEG